MVKKQKGFSLLELMIAVLIVGLISAVAYPSYQQYITDSRRVDAQQALLSFANAMERFKVENMVYTGAASGGANSGPPAATLFPSQAPVDGGTAFYNLTIESSATRSYILRADPIGTQNGDGLMEILSTGIKRWDKNDDGDATDAGENNWED
ncbi:MAG: prepilin-type N-terminal cleavage/methylation domain-containing protein [Neptuniibacter sp.]|nr:prepilin-type N-terminal cleavage/methylation domain-containing protein [Neptuniibacter sp.]